MTKSIALHVSVSQLGIAPHTGEVGRPQSNPRVYLSTPGCEHLLRQGVTEKQIRRAAFAQLRTMLDLPAKTVIARNEEYGYFMVKSNGIKSNLLVTVMPAPMAPSGPVVAPQPPSPPSARRGEPAAPPAEEKVVLEVTSSAAA